ncbi:hypothetical protein IGI04_002454 [Brassica rapa subsp. trilocularis]|uniref:Replication protein A 70 kDa DNA-binding subunit B/D first OB fold domain-containing protein n=1 Tax=Brassica rapa subsp. trilocularis TaxID=1813537 RepID=A0ABQ7NVK7_BRACM|nr:hypothetical protein IGI04_002454 [Brassica rapa subsp. trilocularis]
MRLLVELRDPKFCSVKEWKGAYSISSGYNSTHILLNPTLNFIEKFKARHVSCVLRLTRTLAMVRAKKNIVSYVRELKPRKDTLRIEVRIVRLWKNYKKESGNTIEMVVVDKEGTRIHASVGEPLIKNFDDKLREGEAIVLQLFKVTVLEKYFADFSDILGGNLDHSCLVGELVSYAVKESFTLCGCQIVNFGSLKNKIIKGKDNMRLLVELRDPNRSNLSTMIICVTRFCSVKEWKGAYSISSGYSSTHILLNPTLDFIEEFKARYVSCVLRSRPMEEFNTYRCLF